MQIPIMEAPITLPLPALPAQVVGVRVVARRDCCIDQSQNMFVYLSKAAAWQQKSTPCLKQDLTAGGLKPTVLGQSVIALCPLSTTARYGELRYDAGVSGIN